MFKGKWKTLNIVFLILLFTLISFSAWDFTKNNYLKQHHDNFENSAKIIASSIVNAIESQHLVIKYLFTDLRDNKQLEFFIKQRHLEELDSFRTAIPYLGGYQIIDNQNNIILSESYSKKYKPTELKKFTKKLEGNNFDVILNREIQYSQVSYHSRINEKFRIIIDLSFDDILDNIFSGENNKLINDYNLVMTPVLNEEKIIFSSFNDSFERNEFTGWEFHSIASLGRDNIKIKLIPRKESISILKTTERKIAFLFFVLYLACTSSLMFFLKNRHQNKNNIKTLTFLQSILDSASYSIISTDTNGLIKSFSKGSEKMLNYSSDEVIGQKNPALFHVVDEIISATNELNNEFNLNLNPGFETFIYKTKRGLNNEREWKYIRKDGTSLIVLLSVSAMKDQTGTIVGYLGIAADISKIKEQESQLLEVKNQALESSRAKGQFLANMSHEIRTPLNGIIGMSELALTDKVISKNLEEVFTIILQSSNHLLSILNNILDIAKVESGKMQIEISAISLYSLIKMLETHFIPSFQIKKLKLEIEVCSSIDNIFYSDPTKLNQILFNLISNSLKFTEKGTVKIFFKKNLDENIEVVISDSGIGISEKELSLLFENFSQANNSISRKYGGTGLGLSMSKGLANLLGGDIYVKSSPQGSHFTIKIKNHVGILQIDPDEKTSDEKVIDEENLTFNPHSKILIAEDNLINQKIIHAILIKHIANIDIVSNGQEALDLITKKNYDLIFMDIQMPTMDGIEFTKIARNKFGLKTPIVAITANAFKEDRIFYLSIGINVVIPKPFKRIEILEVLKKFLTT